MEKHKELGANVTVRFTPEEWAAVKQLMHKTGIHFPTEVVKRVVLERAQGAAFDRSPLVVALGGHITIRSDDTWVV